MSQLTRLTPSPGPLAVAALGLMLCPALAPAAADQIKLEQSYGKLPLSFEANQGQSDAQVKFLARGPGYALFLTPTEAVLSLKKPPAQRKAARKLPAPSEPRGGTVLRMRLVGGNPTPRVIGQEKLPGKVNYLLGKDPSKWRTGVSTYAKVKYEAVYPGVDLLYYGNQRQLEYDFVLAPGRTPQAITLAFPGADRIEVNTEGELVLHTKGGEVRMHTPVVYQETKGVKQAIAGHYVLKDHGQVGFKVAAYDTTKTLVIDPVLVYSTYLGGDGFEYASGIALDRVGNAYVTGVTDSGDFPTQDPLQPGGGGGSDAFVAKLNSSGTALRFSTYFGGSDTDIGLDIAVDIKGNAYVTGISHSADFPTKNPLQPALGGSDPFVPDAFVAKLNSSGTALRYSTYLGGGSFDEGNGIAVDRAGSAYVTGLTDSDDFPTKTPLQPAIDVQRDAFVAKLNIRGTALRYSTYLGGSDTDEGYGIAVDRAGNAYVTGLTRSGDFPTKTSLQPALGGGVDAFVAKLNSSGTALRYSTYLGGSDRDDGLDIAVNLAGNAYVTGTTFSADFPTQAPLQPALGGSRDTFVAKLNIHGTGLRYSTYLGGSDRDGGFGGVDDTGLSRIAVDPAGNAYVAGMTSSTDFPTHNPVQPASGGDFDAFVTKIGP